MGNYNLTKREMEILLLIANGMKNCEIAEILFISHRTVESHKANLCGKLNYKSTVELNCFAVTNKEKLAKAVELISDLQINL